ncbi:hypothetical protein WDZ11_22390 (plasmid) [Roseomonas mucosa]|uniref:hypothetical protein n=1 Tax=Roseomonas mucosa TaxID=207340 RepID=UPI0030D2ECCB
MIRGLLLRHLDSLGTDAGESRLAERATRLLGAMAGVLTWMRDREALRLDEGVIRLALQLRPVATLANRRAYLFPSSNRGCFVEQRVPAMPESLVYPLNAYLADLPGYETALPYEQQRGGEARRQHARVLFLALPSSSGGGLAS